MQQAVQSPITCLRAMARAYPLARMSFSVKTILVTAGLGSSENVARCSSCERW